MALACRTVRVPGALGVAPRVARPVRVILARAEPPSGARVTREYREGDAEVSVPSAGPGVQRQADGLYVDVNAPPPRAAQKDNMSKEMKARLRAEYTGFGGAENKAMSNNYFLWMCVIVSVLAVCSKLIGAI